MLGDYDGDQTIYKDLTSILDGLVDKNGDYILEESNGKSIFGAVFDNQETLGENQEQLQSDIIVEHNKTRTEVKNQHTETRGLIESSRELILGSVGDGWWSVIACLGIVFLILWIFVLKPRINRQRYNNEYDEEDNYEEKEGLIDNIKKRNPFRLKAVSTSEPPPDCYRDGVSYDPYTEAACSTCPYAEECESVKLKKEAEEEIRQHQEEQKRSRKSPISFQPNLDDMENRMQPESETTPLGNTSLDF